MRVFHHFGSAAQPPPFAAARRRPRRAGRGWRTPKCSEAAPKRFGPCGPQGAGPSPCVRTGSGGQMGAVAGHLPRPGARRSARAAPKCSEVAPRAIGRSSGAAGASPEAPRGRRHSLGRGPTRLVGAPAGSPTPRQVSPRAACAARPRSDGKTFAGRGHGTRGEMAPSQVSPSIASVPHLEYGMMAAPGRPLSSGAPTPAQLAGC